MPWYKQFWPWFLILLPGSAVAGGIVTLFIAFDKQDSLVVDDYYKEGLAINRVLAEDDAARHLQLHADLAVNLTDGDVEVSLNGKTDGLPPSLELKWIHPISSAKDFSMTLQRSSGAHYRGHLAAGHVNQKLPGRWHVQLDGSRPQPWRLRREIDLDRGQRFDL